MFVCLYVKGAVQFVVPGVQRFSLRQLLDADQRFLAHGGRVAQVEELYAQPIAELSVDNIAQDALMCEQSAARTAPAPDWPGVCS